MVAWVVKGLGIVIEATSHVPVVTSGAGKGRFIRLSERVEELVTGLVRLIESAIKENLSTCDSGIRH